MRRINIFLLLILIVLLVGCKEESVYIKPLIQNEIFTQTEDRYFVYFYKDNCGFCETTKPIILDYLNSLEMQENSDKRVVYGFDLSDSNNMFFNGETEYGIFRIYTGDAGDGSGSNLGKYKVNGVKVWNELYIAGVPSLITVTLNVETNEKESHLVAESKQEIQTVLENQLNS